MKNAASDPVPPRKQRARRRRRPVVDAAALTAVVGIVLAVVIIAAPPERGPDSADSETVAGSTPVNTPLYIDPELQAIAAAREDPRFDRLAETPQAKWFTDWSTVATAHDDVSRYLAGAATANAIPTMVLYRIPQRDCGAWSRGGARDEQEYKDWVEGIAEGLQGHDEAMVVLEPDALPQLGKCEQGDRLGMLRFAVDRLSTTGARVYIDAGNETWHSPAEIAERLRLVGVDKVTGFSLNVAAHYTTQGEIDYAQQVRSELSKLGINDAHFIIDIARNGAGPQPNYCNPPGARLGEPPRLYEGGELDGLLWIINPGETDGACRGGPPRGFWAPAALDLLGLGEGK
jgi:endoglucanase